MNDKIVSTLCGTPGVIGTEDGIGTNAKFNCPWSLAFDSTSRILFVSEWTRKTIRQIFVDEGRVETLAGIPGVRGHVDSTLNNSKFLLPIQLAFNASTRELFVVDDKNSLNRQ